MFEINKILGKTSYFSTFSNVGIFDLGHGEVLLIDTCDHPRMVKNLDRLLCAKSLKVKTVINTHCHVDHIAGNKFFEDKYACELLADEEECFFVRQPDFEAKFYYAGIDTDKSRNPFFSVEPSIPKAITKDNVPEGIEVFDLPGHSFNMIGVKTQDDVVFLADAVLSKKTWEKHKLPFFHDVNSSIDTLEKIKEMDGKVFVPSHDDPTENISELAQYNINKMNERKDLVYDICEGHSYDEMFSLLIQALDLKLTTSKYPMYAIMLRNFLQSLVEDKAIYAKIEDNARFIYHRN